MDRGTTAICSQLPDEEWRREKLRQALDTARGELFFAKRVLVVEGDTERLALPEYAKKFGTDIDGAGATIVEVGGKRNLIDFAELAISFGIPTAIIFDKDSSDFRGKKEEEVTYNQRLEGLQTNDGSVRVWCLDPDYEACAKQTAGEDRYRAIAERYPEDQYGKGKARRGRMIAADTDMPIPTQISEAIRWLTSR